MRLKGDNINRLLTWQSSYNIKFDERGRRFSTSLENIVWKKEKWLVRIISSFLKQLCQLYVNKQICHPKACILLQLHLNTIFDCF